MRSKGFCPKCSSRELYITPTVDQLNEGTLGGPLEGKYEPFMLYVCTDCGYTERYIVNPARLQELKKKATRARPA